MSITEQKTLNKLLKKLGYARYTYAQEYKGQKLHLVQEITQQDVSQVALCGRNCCQRGNWRMTINMPLANACKRCLQVFEANR